MNLIENETYLNIDFNATPLQATEFEACTFKQCSFNELDLSKRSFIDCDFIECDLSLIKVIQTSFKDVRFKNCKMLGIHFDKCNPMLLSLSFDQCILNLCSFYRLKLKGLKAGNCTLHEADFVETDLTKAHLVNSDLNDAVFENTILEGADLRGVRNLILDPEKNYIKKARFNADALPGLLMRYQIIVD